MAIPRDAELAQLGPWKRGSNNVALETSVPGGSARIGTNVDFMPDGKVRRRQGITQLVVGPYDSLWSDGDYALCRSVNQLFRFTPGSAPKLLYTGIAVDTYLVYCNVNQYVYVSDGSVALRVSKLDDTVRPWGVAAPAGQPTLSALPSAGGLDAGSYQVAITYVTADGEESGSPLAAQIRGPGLQGGGILLSNIPQPSEPHVVGISIYMTNASAERLRFYTSIPVGITTMSLVKSDLGKDLDTLLLQQLPAGDAATLSNGCLYVSVDDMVIWSEPMMYGQFHPAKDYVQLGAKIDLLAAAVQGGLTEGVFVAAGNLTYFLTGRSPTDFTAPVAYHSGAIPGSLTYVPGTAFASIEQMPAHSVPLWIAKNGVYCIGKPDGTVVPLTEGRFVAAVGEHAFNVYREFKGVRQIIGGIEPPTEKSVLAVSDAASVTVTRNGIVI